MAVTKHTPNPLPTLPRPTKAYHKSQYPYIDPSRPELNVSAKTLLITGGGGGVGSGICKAFAQAGVERIIIIGRTLVTLEVIQSSLRSDYPEVEVTIHAASVLDTPEIQRIVRSAGKIDFVVSAAAICHPVSSTSTVDPEVLSEVLQTNTVGPFNVISTVLHERAIQGWDHELKVIFVSSALSHIHISHLSGYAASKSAMNTLMTHLHVQWNERGVSFFSVHPGLIYTTLTGKVFPEDSPIWEDADMSAGFCVWLCHPEAAFLSGKVLWASWDAQELLEKKEWIEKYPWNLEQGLNLPTAELPDDTYYVVERKRKA